MSPDEGLLANLDLGSRQRRLALGAPRLHDARVFGRDRQDQRRVDGEHAPLENRARCCSPGSSRCLWRPSSARSSIDSCAEAGFPRRAFRSGGGSRPGSDGSGRAAPLASRRRPSDPAAASGGGASRAHRTNLGAERDGRVDGRGVDRADLLRGLAGGVDSDLREGLHRERVHARGV